MEDSPKPAPFAFAPQARWIWAQGGGRTCNDFVCFRKIFTAGEKVEAAHLTLTADSRYEVFLNGHWLGHGPARSWPSPWPVDGHDLRDHLLVGRNVLAIRVQHFGLSTFQYLHSEPGLIAQLDLRDENGERREGTDRSWLAERTEAFAWPVPRISCQLGWEEQFDARKELRDDRGNIWTEPDYDDSTWTSAQEGEPAGGGDHAEFEDRGIPFLTREVTEPLRIVTMEAVRPAPYRLSVNLREMLNAEDRTANICEGNFFLLTYLWSDAAASGHIQFGISGHEGWAWKFNGELLDGQGGGSLVGDSATTPIRLQAGWNPLLGRMPDTTHLPAASIAVWSEHPVRFVGHTDPGARDQCTFLGPFHRDDLEDKESFRYVVRSDREKFAGSNADFDRIWQCGRPDERDFLRPFARPVPAECLVESVGSICHSDQVDPGLTVRGEQAEALLHDTDEWATFHPLSGADVRILLDFGDEVIGYQEFEIDAAAGTQLDVLGFEFIQQDGRINLSEKVSNAFRYTCREGVQRYRTFVRRGFRYCWLIFRNQSAPVRVRFFRALFSTYPVTQAGSFRCSDPQLTHIWEVGVRTARCCAEDAYTDSPAYEQTFWVGDARNEALVDLMVHGDPRLSARCWLLAARSLDRSPLVEAQAPSGWQVLLPAWMFLWMRWAKEHFQFTGDHEFARAALPFLDRNFEGILEHIESRDLFQINAWNMLDWAPMDVPRLGIVTHLNCFAVLALRETAALASWMGETDRAQTWKALANRIAVAVNRHLWDEEKKAYVDCLRADGTSSPVFSQQTQTLASLSGVATGERDRRCLALMENPPDDFVQAGSPFFMFFLLERLAETGRFSKMMEWIRTYWGTQIAAGATTFWEMYFPGNGRHTRSHCHGWASGPTYFLSRYVLGVEPLEPGFRRLRISPNLNGLAWAEGTIPTPQGKVSVSCQMDGERFLLDLHLPDESTAEVWLPFEAEVEVTQGRMGPFRGQRFSCPGGRIEVTATPVVVPSHPERWQRPKVRAAGS